MEISFTIIDIFGVKRQESGGGPRHVARGRLLSGTQLSS